MDAMPNHALRAVRLGMRLSQDDFARVVRAAGDRLGEPNDASKRTVQRWEDGSVVTPRPVYARALEAATGQPIEALGFQPTVTADGRGGHDLTTAPLPVPTSTTAQRGRGNLSGVWLSRYEYYSSSRAAAYVGQHFVVVLQHGDRLTVRSLPGSAKSSLAIDLTVDGQVVTGTWVEDTDPTGHYRGARYHGAIQMLAEPTGRKMTGKWVGFGKEMDVNTGPWDLIFQTASTSTSTMAEYNRVPG